MNFGKWILAAFFLFGVFIFTLTAICVKQDISLVSKEYYRDELQYQKKLDKINSANHLAHLPSIEVRNGLVNVSFTSGLVAEKGTLKFERPSNANLDREFSLAPGQSSQDFNLKVWVPGLYRASLSWSADGKEFFMEKQIIL
jgi:hypothetical protein